MELAKLRTELNKQIIAGSVPDAPRRDLLQGLAGRRDRPEGLLHRADQDGVGRHQGRLRLPQEVGAGAWRRPGRHSGDHGRAARPEHLPVVARAWRRHDADAAGPAVPQRPGHRQRLLDLRSRLHARLLDPPHHQFRPRRGVHPGRVPDVRPHRLPVRHQRPPRERGAPAHAAVPPGARRRRAPGRRRRRRAGARGLPPAPDVAAPIPCSPWCRASGWPSPW